MAGEKRDSDGSAELVGPRRMGRPRNSDAARRRQDIQTAALRRFASDGYAATSLTAIAKDVGITQPGLYRYYADKQSLYEEVFRSALDQAWTAVRERVSSLPFRDRGLLGLAEAMNLAGLAIDRVDARATNVFLTTVPVEAIRHPELHHLLEVRASVQDREIRAIVLPAFEAGMMPAFDDVETAVHAARLLLMGWAIETFTQRENTQENLHALRSVIEHLGRPVAGSHAEPEVDTA
jgi:AcrR family transcriptional regulator